MYRRNLAYMILPLLLIFSALSAQEQQSSLSLTEAERSWLQDHPVITFAPDPFFPPIEFFDDEGRYSGLSSDYLSYIGTQLGVEFKPVRSKNWSEAVTRVRSGETYMLSAELKTMENIKYYAFSKAYLKFPMIILARDNVVRQQSYEDLSGKRLAVVASYPDIHLIRDNYPDIELVEVDNVVSGLRITAFGQVDAMIVLQPVASYFLEQEGIANLHVVGVVDFFTDTGFAINKEHAILAGILDKALDAMPQREKQSILERWVLLKADLQFDYGPLIKLSAVAGVIILLLIAWIFQTQHQKQRLKQEVAKRKLKENELKQANQKLELAVITDPLTGVTNRRGLYDLMNKEHSRVTRYGGDLAMLMLDADNFKQVNDVFGHSAGDQALCKLTEICSNLVRANDVVSRFGGEEFALLLPNTRLDKAIVLAERIRATVEISSIRINNTQQMKITVSIGVASYDNGDTPDSLLNKADQALYAAKRNGRNRVVCH